jgi:acetylornithine/succinyldiaminopimelate/putrescine aminotransferase
MSHLMNTYNRLPVAFTHGRGAWLNDEQGKEYLDALAGIAVNGLGHAHPRLVAALAEQVGRLIHTSNIYRVREQEALADRLCALSGMQEVFFGNSGSEANEGALKLVRLYGHRNGEPAAQTLVMERAWHGRTLATLAATGNEKARRASTRCRAASSACLTTTSRRWSARPLLIRGYVRSGSRFCREKAASRLPTSTTCVGCGACATSAAGC